jgi:hypothetical protein
MTSPLSKAVMDINPWPRGQGFLGSNLWWHYVRALDDAHRLEVLLTLALFNEEVCQRLLVCDLTLLLPFAFSEETVELLMEIKVSTLEEFAEAIISNAFFSQLVHSLDNGEE